jgi:hypothetical protein
MGNKITICHWNEGGSWDAIEISTEALNGHDNHGMDIWPPVADVTPGMNWPKGETVYLNGCAIQAIESPSPSPSPSLPETGSAELMGLTVLSFVLIVVGLMLVGRLDKKSRTVNDPKEFRESRPEDPDG